MHHLVELDETRLEMTLIGHRVKISKKNQEESASIEDPNKDQDTNKDKGLGNEENKDWFSTFLPHAKQCVLCGWRLQCTERKVRKARWDFGQTDQKI